MFLYTTFIEKGYPVTGLCPGQDLVQQIVAGFGAVAPTPKLPPLRSER